MLALAGLKTQRRLIHGSQFESARLIPGPKIFFLTFPYQNNVSSQVFLVFLWTLVKINVTIFVYASFAWRM